MEDEKGYEINHHRYITGQIMLCSVFIFIALLSIIARKEIDNGVRAMLLAYIAGETYITWKYKRSKVFLFFSIVAGINAVLALIEVALVLYTGG